MPINQFAKIYPYVDDDGYLLEMEYSADGGILKLYQGHPIRTDRKLKLNEIGILYSSTGASGLVMMREADPGVDTDPILIKDVGVSSSGRLAYTLNAYPNSSIYKINISNGLAFPNNRTITDILFVLKTFIIEEIIGRTYSNKRAIISCYENNNPNPKTEYEINIDSLNSNNHIIDYRIIEPMNIDYITIAFKATASYTIPTPTTSEVYLTPYDINGAINISYATYLAIVPSLPIPVSNS